MFIILKYLKKYLKYFAQLWYGLINKWKIVIIDANFEKINKI